MIAIRDEQKVEQKIGIINQKYPKNIIGGITYGKRNDGNCNFSYKTMVVKSES